jgi:hypothetical protein
MDLHMEAIEKNINYLNFIPERHEEDYREYGSCRAAGPFLISMKEKARKWHKSC